MSLEKVVSEDKIEIIGEYKSVQVRTCTQILEDGVVLSSSYHRHVVMAGQDTSDQSAEVQAICAVVHTPEVVAAFAASQAPVVAEEPPVVAEEPPVVAEEPPVVEGE